MSEADASAAVAAPEDAAPPKPAPRKPPAPEKPAEEDAATGATSGASEPAADKVVESAPAKIDGELPLPEGWEKDTTPDGKVYYIDHISKKTSWKHPSLIKKKAPKKEAPKTEVTKTDTPKAETAATEESAEKTAEEPVEEPKTEEPPAAAEEPKAEEPLAEEASSPEEPPEAVSPSSDAAEDDTPTTEKKKPLKSGNRFSLRRRPAAEKEGADGASKNVRRSMFGKKKVAAAAASEVTILEMGWFVKKGKGSNSRSDQQRRWFELVDAPAAINYYAGLDGDGKAKNLKGTIPLTDGFSVEKSEDKLVIYTPGRRWELEKQWAGDGNLDKWQKKLQALKVAHDLGDHEYTLQDKGDYTACKDSIYLSGWFVKKGKGTETTADLQKRYFQLVGPKPTIHYYKYFKDDLPRNHKGMIVLQDGFHIEKPIKSGGVHLLVLRTPTRKWRLETCDGEQSTAWFDKLEQLQQKHDLKWDPLKDFVFNPDDAFENGEIKGWFRKKGKNRVIDDFQNRWFVYKQYSKTISYYASVNEDGTPNTHKGDIDLTSFDVSREKGRVFITTIDTTVTKGSKKSSRVWDIAAVKDKMGIGLGSDEMIQAAEMWENVLLWKKAHPDENESSRVAVPKKKPAPARPPPPPKKDGAAAAADPTQEPVPDALQGDDDNYASTEEEDDSEDEEGEPVAAAEAPAEQAPAAEEITTEEPATEETASEEPATEETAAEEPATEETASEEPATAEPAAAPVPAPRKVD